MAIDYVSVSEPFNTKYTTWIIGYCPDTDSFFATEQRHFFWETENDFNSEREAIEYFESNLQYFIEIRNMALSMMFSADVSDNYCYLENTSKKYMISDE